MNFKITINGKEHTVTREDIHEFIKKNYHTGTPSTKYFISPDTAKLIEVVIDDYLFYLSAHPHENYENN